MMSRIMRMVVVLPAPLGPSRPYTDPRGTWSDRSRTATCSSYRFTTLRMSIARSDIGWVRRGRQERARRTCTARHIGRSCVGASSFVGTRRSAVARSFARGGRCRRSAFFRACFASSPTRSSSIVAASLTKPIQPVLDTYSARTGTVDPARERSVARACPKDHGAASRARPAAARRRRSHSRSCSFQSTRPGTPSSRETAWSSRTPTDRSTPSEINARQLDGDPPAQRTSKSAAPIRISRPSAIARCSCSSSPSGTTGNPASRRRCCNARRSGTSARTPPSSPRCSPPASSTTSTTINRSPSRTAFDSSRFRTRSTSATRIARPSMQRCRSRCAVRRRGNADDFKGQPILYGLSDALRRAAPRRGGAVSRLSDVARSRAAASRRARRHAGSSDRRRHRRARRASWRHPDISDLEPVAAAPAERRLARAIVDDRRRAAGVAVSAVHSRARRRPRVGGRRARRGEPRRPTTSCARRCCSPPPPRRSPRCSA